MESVLILLGSIVCASYSQSIGYHKYGMKLACDETNPEIFLHFEDQIALYYDNKAERVVTTLPDFADPVVIPDVFKDAAGNENNCKEGLAVLNKAYKDLPEALDPPWVSIYTKHEVKLRTNNTLVCHMFEFFPPLVRVTWSKNDLNVTEGVTLSPYYHNSDGTVSVFSTLSFIPEEGDLYSCTVEHRALERPLTRTWDVELDQPRVWPSVVCAVGLCLGIAGAATGVFLIIRANKHHT